MNKEIDNNLNYEKGVQYFNKGDYFNSINAFNAAFNKSNSWKVLQCIGACYFKLYQYPLAIRHLRKSIELKENWDTYKGLANALYRSTRYKEAVVAYKKSITLKKSKDATLYSGIAWSMYQLKDYVKAEEYFQYALNITKTWKEYQGIGWALFNQKNFTNSIKAFKNSIDLQEDWYSLQGEGLCYFYMTLYDKSVKSLEASKRLKIEPHTLQYLGIGYYEMCLYRKAIENLEASLTIIEDWKTYELLGSSYESIDELEKAITSYKLAYLMNINKELLVKTKEIMAKANSNYLISWNAVMRNIKTSATTILKEEFILAQSSVLKKLVELLDTKESYYLLWTLSATKNYLRNNFINKVNRQCQTKDCNVNQIGIDQTISAYKKIRSNIVSIGDSHGEILSHNEYIDHYRVGAGTAYNLIKKNSTSESNKQIKNILNNYTPNDTLVILTFGEIDIRAHISKQSLKQNIVSDVIIRKTILRYMEYIDELLSKGYQVAINGPHCGGGEGQSSSTMQQRNDNCEYFNRVLKYECNVRNIRFYSFFEYAINQSSLTKNNEYFRDPIHLHYPFTPKGKYIQNKILFGLIDNKENSSGEAKGEFNDMENSKYKNLEKSSTENKILLSNIPGIRPDEPDKQLQILRGGILINSDRYYGILVELTIFSKIKRIELIFNPIDKVVLETECILFNSNNSTKEESTIINKVTNETERGNNTIKFTHEFNNISNDFNLTRYVMINISTKYKIKFLGYRFYRYRF